VVKKKNRKLKKEYLRPKKSGFFILPLEVKRWMWGILMVVIALVITLSFFNLAGIAGKATKSTFLFLIGNTFFAFPLFFLLLATVIFKTQTKFFWFPMFLSVLILTLGVSGILSSFNRDKELGGKLGYFISAPLLKFFGFFATLIVFFGIVIIGCLVLIQLLRVTKPKEKPFPEKEKVEEKKPSLVSSLVRKIFVPPTFKVKRIEPPSPLTTKEILKEELPIKAEKTPEKPKLIDYEPPPLELLEEDKGQASGGDLQINSTIIKKTLENFGISVQMANANIGPTVTQYTLKPAEGVKLSKITVLSNDLALALAAHPIRIEAPIPGKALVGIEVPNKVRTRVRLRNLFSLPEFQNHPSSLAIVLGRDVAGNPVFTDLGKMPHLLVAGATGTGKTIYLNSLILSLLYRSSPEILRFILIDPKRVEFPVYQDLPHLLCPVIYDPQRTVIVLKWLIQEMERRFEILAEAKARDITLYNEIVLKQGGHLMPYIIFIIDELADLMAARGKEIEAGIVRLAQMARAVGIHLVVATQRPSVEVITGLIKANITARIAFQVASQIDSRTILDVAGAEKLLGLGDLLYLSAETVKPKRIQGAYVSEKEVKRVMEFFKKKGMGPIFKNELEESLKTELDKRETGEKGEIGEIVERGFFFEGEDPLYEEAKKLVIRSKKASASLLQRHLRIGYARAARLIDILEERGVVGPGEGAKPREVYLPPEEENEEWQKV
jgi:S-DNA-T family DNA segregation ATPase FtsK/SpoIIIE